MAIGRLTDGWEEGESSWQGEDVQAMGGRDK